MERKINILMMLALTDLRTPAMLERANTPASLVISKHDDESYEEDLSAGKISCTTVSPVKPAKAQKSLSDTGSMIGLKSPGSLGQLNIMSRSDSKKGLGLEFGLGGSKDNVHFPSPELNLRKSPLHPSLGSLQAGLNDIGRKKPTSKLILTGNTSLI
jgi:hypothetical protein